jgi:hypothetical protein
MRLLPSRMAVGCGDDRNRPSTGLRTGINRERCGSFLTASYKAAIQGWPNAALKGKCRLLAALKVGFLIWFGGFVEHPLAACPLPLRWA